MPSGAKKRKAAKRKKEEQLKGKEKDEETGSILHPPVSPSNDPHPSSPPPPQPQGNGHEDRMPHDDWRRSESGEFGTPSETPFATPLSYANHPLAEEAGEETPGSQRVVLNSSLESSETGNGETDEPAHRPDERGNDDPTELEVEMVASAADEVGKGEPREAEVAEGTEMEKPAEESVIAVEQSVLTSEEAKQEKEVPGEILKEAPVVISHKCESKVVALPAKDEIKEEASYEREVKVVPLPGEDEASYEREVKVVPLPGEDEVKEEASYEREMKVVPLPGEDEVKEATSYEREVKVVPLPDEDDVKNRPSYECEVKVVPQLDDNEVKERPSYECEVKVVPQLDDNEVKERPSYVHDANVAPPPDKDEVKEWPYHEREGQVAALPDEDKVKEWPSHEREVKVVPLPDEDVTGEQCCASGEASQGTRRAETVPSTEIAPLTPLVGHRARWWNCCGLLDVLVGSER